MTTDAEPKATDPAIRFGQLDDRASRLTGAVWFLLDTQSVLIERIGAGKGDAGAFRRALADMLDKLHRDEEVQLSPRAKATYRELLDRLRNGAPTAKSYISPEVERTKLP